MSRSRLPTLPMRKPWIWIVLLFVSACSNVRLGVPPIRELYHDDAQRLARNPVIVIHGILGSRLVDLASEKVVWGAFTRDAIDVSTPEGARTLAIDLKSGGGNQVVATGPVEKIDVDLLFGIVSVDVYKQILRALGIGGYVDSVKEGPGYATDHYTCHSFFYDWRLDNVQNAMALGRFIDQTRLEIDRNARDKLKSLREQATPRSLEDAAELEAWLERGYRFDIVAHSMGGLIARYFLRYGASDLPADGSEPRVTWAGARDVDRLVQVGTPNLGSMEALEQLLNGMDLGFFLPSFDRALLGSMPSVYQLLPRNSNRLFLDRRGRQTELDLFDLELWEANQWGLLNPKSARTLEWLLPGVSDPTDRLEIARSHLGWCLDRARRFHGALDKDPESPGPSELRLFASDTIETKARAELRPSPDGSLQVRFHGADLCLPGDGTVARYSALADRSFGAGPSRTWLNTPIFWSSATFLPDNHVGLTSNPQFTDNLLFYLLQQAPAPRSP